MNALSDGTYSDCKIEVTDAAGNVSDALEINSFTVDSSQPVMRSAVVWEGGDANRIAVFASENITDVSDLAGFSVTVNGHAAAISMVAPHESISSRIWITLSNRIYEGEAVEVSYSGNGAAPDIAGNDLAYSQVDVDKNATTPADPAPEMQSSVIWEGNYAKRIALTVSEALRYFQQAGGYDRVGVTGTGRY